MTAFSFADLQGWDQDDHALALTAYAASFSSVPSGWPRPDQSEARRFFEDCFGPVLTDSPAGLLTGYYEPILQGSPVRTTTFTVALHGAPPGLVPGEPWHSRADIEDRDLLSGHEIAWVADPVEAFLAQVQGSARIVFPDGRQLRLAYAGRNGHPYRSIGAHLVALGQIAADAVSADAIRAWCRQTPDQVRSALQHNPSYVFFRVLNLPHHAGPVGALGVSVAAMRSLAVDPAHIPLGAPVWIDAGPGHRRLTVAQDTGSAIKGPQRADLFVGSGDAAGQTAGSLKRPVRLVTLMPRTAVRGRPS